MRADLVVNFHPIELKEEAIRLSEFLRIQKLFLVDPSHASPLHRNIARKLFGQIPSRLGRVITLIAKGSGFRLNVVEAQGGGDGWARRKEVAVDGGEKNGKPGLRRRIWCGIAGEKEIKKAESEAEMAKAESPGFCKNQP